MYFIDRNIRFIAINDNVDNTVQRDNDITPIKNYFNEWFARDTSKKIRAVFKSKGNSGKHLSSNPPFGYIKDPNDKDKWIIDEEAAVIVKEIFDLYIGGMSIPKIARLLTDRKVPTPQTEYITVVNVAYKPLKIGAIKRCPRISVVHVKAYISKTVFFGILFEHFFLVYDTITVALLLVVTRKSAVKGCYFFTSVIIV